LKCHVIAFSTPRLGFNLKGILFLLRFVRACLKSLLLVGWLRPRLVVGFGSFASVPGVLAGSVLQTRTLLHEQNLVLGEANQFLMPWADRIATSFEETAQWCPQDKVIWSGFPLRASFMNVQKAPEDRALDQKFTILVFGGSQGAQRLNRAVLEAMRSLPSEERAKLAVIHIVGNDRRSDIQKAYERLDMKPSVLEFTDRISGLIQSTDIVISRAGAGTIFELAAAGKAAILVPYPYGRVHQDVQAQFLAERGACRVITDNESTSVVLAHEIRDLQTKYGTREKIEASVRQFFKEDANQILTDVSWGLQCQNN
jgi:UDP-N-acetylglucosamine--N-acetylmuramyl-(pentapeptide) pyrophosphoryl-undecaprenol N-acetylglucosamine transferase